MQKYANTKVQPFLKRNQKVSFSPCQNSSQSGDLVEWLCVYCKKVNIFSEAI